MKIEGPSKTGGTKGVSKSGSGNSGDSSFGALVNDAGESEAPAAASRPSSVGALDALIALQSYGDATSEEAVKKAKKRARDLLDLLDQLRMGLLSGEMAVGSIRNLTDTIAAERAQITDPRLAEVLDEIDLRAQVELAKLGL